MGGLTRFALVALVAVLAACNGDVDGPAGARDANYRAKVKFTPAEAVLSRLTSAQYRNAMADLFGDPLPAFQLEADTQPHLFSNIGASTTTVSENGVAQWEQASLDITATVFGDAARRTALVGCEPTAAGDACTRDFIDRFGQRAWRRPLSLEEVTRYVDLARRSGAADAWGALRFATAGLLQSPNFLYRVELGEPDPDAAGRYRFTGFEMASRLSFFLWNTLPDDELLRAAADGELVTKESVASQASRMLMDKARTRRGFAPFFTEYLGLAKLDTLQRDPALYPQFTPTLGASMRKEIEQLIDNVVFGEDGDFRAMFVSRQTYVNSELAALYGIAAPEAVDVNTWVPVTLPEDGPRAGLLTTAGLLALNSQANRTSPTKRGQFVRERLLCSFVPPPPQNFSLDVEDETVAPDATLREKLWSHRERPECAGCHAAIDPIGLGLEDFDAVGAFRTVEHTAGGDRELDASGDLDGDAFNGARELGEILQDDPRTSSCLVEQIYRYASSRLEATTEAPVIEALTESFEEGGNHISKLLGEIAVSDGFRYVAKPKGATTGVGQ